MINRKPTLIIYFANPRLETKSSTTLDEVVLTDGTTFGDLRKNTALKIAALEQDNKNYKAEIESLKNSLKLAIESVNVVNETNSKLFAEIQALKNNK